MWRVHRAVGEIPDLVLMWQVDAQSLENHKSITTRLSSVVSEGPQNFYYFPQILIYVYHIVLHARFEQDSTLSCLLFLSLTYPSQRRNILLLERPPRCGSEEKPALTVAIGHWGFQKPHLSLLHTS